MIVDGDCGLVEYKETAILAAVNIVTILLASLLITVPMFILITVENVHRRLGIIMVFTSLFSIMFVVQYVSQLPYWLTFIDYIFVRRQNVSRFSLLPPHLQLSR